ncbi:hypothetical protein [Geodermatophilus sp. CPCC 205506]|uniref:hypothetical protein n=1 Tax=Geodermatophilus sp. CPCC 205506 TaxID=2936596 RepID=UPI003EEBC6BD
MHTSDVVARRIDDPPPAPPQDTGLVLHCLRSMADVAAQAPALCLGRADDVRLSLKVLNPLRRARWPRQIAGRFSRGEVCHLATLDGEVASWIWMSRRPLVRDRSSGLRFRLAPGDAYIYHFWAVPEYRHLGSARFVMSGALESLYRQSMIDDRSEGHGSAPVVYGYIDRPNPANLLLTTVLFGFRVAQTVRSVRLLDLVGLQVPRSATPSGPPCSGTRASRSALRAPLTALGRRASD